MDEPAFLPATRVTLNLSCRKQEGMIIARMELCDVDLFVEHHIPKSSAVNQFIPHKDQGFGYRGGVYGKHFPNPLSSLAKRFTSSS